MADEDPTSRRAMAPPDRAEGVRRVEWVAARASFVPSPRTTPDCCSRWSKCLASRTRPRRGRRSRTRDALPSQERSAAARLGGSRKRERYGRPRARAGSSASASCRRCRRRQGGFTRRSAAWSAPRRRGRSCLAMSERQRLEPRSLRRDDAAAYVGVGSTKFDELVAAGRMPKPFRIDGCVRWDRRKLDAAIDALSDGEATTRGRHEDRPAMDHLGPRALLRPPARVAAQDPPTRLARHRCVPEEYHAALEALALPRPTAARSIGHSRVAGRALLPIGRVAAARRADQDERRRIIPANPRCSWRQAFRPRGAVDIRRLRDKMVDRPEAANAWLKTLRQIYAWALAAGMSSATRQRWCPTCAARTPTGGTAGRSLRSSSSKRAGRSAEAAARARADALHRRPALRRREARPADDPRRLARVDRGQGRSAQPKHRSLPILPSYRR